MPVRHNSNRNSDGCMTGQDRDDKIGFYGKTPIVQQVLAASPTAAEISTALENLGLTRKT